MTGGSVISSGGIASLTICPQIVGSDPLLSLIVSITNPHQLQVNVPKKKNGALELKIKEGTFALTHRNAILRSIVGIDLHNLLDSGICNGLYLLGGHSASGSYGNQNVVSTSVLASISSWMSVAATLHINNTSVDNVTQILAYLDSADALAKQSFLVPDTGCVTLADLDMYFALRGFFMAQQVELSEAVGNMGDNVSRWFATVEAIVQKMKSYDQRNNQLLTHIPATYFQSSSSVTTSAPLMFFYGVEGEVIPGAPPAPKARTPAPAAPAANGNNKQEAGKASATKPAPGAVPVPGELTEEQKKAAAEKRAKKKAEKAAKTKKQNSNKGGGGAAAPASELNISALDIRVGKILKAWNHETADKLFCEEVDLGEPSGPRKIASGLRPFYSLDDMQQDRLVLVLSNLKPRNLVGFPSHGMVLCASNADHTKVEFVSAPAGAKIGERVMFEGIEGEPASEAQVGKKKMFEKLAPDLKTDDNGGVTWKGKKAMAGGAQCVAVNGMKNAQVA